MKNICISVLLMIILGCTTGKNTHKNKLSATMSKENLVSQMKKEGYSKGSITTNKNAQCPYVLTVEEFKDQLDPINLNDFYKKNPPALVWVKYSSLRRKSRCADARPVLINEIKIREH
ncbi:hypothetical protein ACFSTE_00795 [Aquimarina hainanensis]|uniref:Lipoprotein n=1 Tax=Aquimarina hainanensis TaxID=1578017 RepID=A0ABW5N2L6_9FLAO|nr:hypothetical protein [Aquimarina sp. TRL1]QKX04538.1 hypothetical protein HN014_06290 [Aquimarina sp. TRL1]